MDSVAGHLKGSAKKSVEIKFAFTNYFLQTDCLEQAECEYDWIELIELQRETSKEDIVFKRK